MNCPMRWQSCGQLGYLFDGLLVRSLLQAKHFIEVAPCRRQRRKREQGEQQSHWPCHRIAAAPCEKGVGEGWWRRWAALLVYLLRPAPGCGLASGRPPLPPHSRQQQAASDRMATTVLYYMHMYLRYYSSISRILQRSHSGRLQLLCLLLLIHYGCRIHRYILR